MKLGIIWNYKSVLGNTKTGIHLCINSFALAVIFLVLGLKHLHLLSSKLFHHVLYFRGQQNFSAMLMNKWSYKTELNQVSEIIRRNILSWDFASTTREEAWSAVDIFCHYPKSWPFLYVQSFMVQINLSDFRHLS